MNQSRISSNVRAFSILSSSTNSVNILAKYSTSIDSEMKGKDKKSYLTLLVSIDNKGEYEKEILLNNSIDKVYTVPKLCEQISENKMLIYSMSRKGQKFGTMTLK